MSYRVHCGVAVFLYHFVSFTIILQLSSGVEKILYNYQTNCGLIKILIKMILKILKILKKHIIGQKMSIGHF